MKFSTILFYLMVMVILVGCKATVESEEMPLGSLLNMEEYIEIKDFEGFVVLGKPTMKSVTIRVTPEYEGSYKVAYYGQDINSIVMTDVLKTGSKEPVSFVLDGLKADSTYRYTIITVDNDGNAIFSSETNEFQTAKTPGSPFRFVIQSDSHFNTKADLEIYESVFESMKAFDPDFIMDLGDTFINDNFMESDYETVNQRYYDQLAYFDILTQSTPLYLVMGNHEGEYGYLNDQTEDNLLVYATKSRKQYYPNPVPNGFYSGNEDIEPYVGSPENYYAYTWGDALFVALDSYRYTTTNPGEGDMWDWTLGLSQYKWLEDILTNSDAKYKFVFAHHAIGNIRGSGQIVDLYEWGGYDRKGNYLFDEQRPEFELPVHELMAKNDVTIFFQGHDHLYAREVIDGVVYQTLPKPAETVPDRKSNQDAYDGEEQVNSGYLEVYVQSSHVKVDYRRMIVASDHISEFVGIVNSYQINQDGELSVLIETDDTDAFNKYETFYDNTSEGKKAKEEAELNKSSESARTEEPLTIEIDGDIYYKPMVQSVEPDAVIVNAFIEAGTIWYYKVKEGEKWVETEHLSASETGVFESVLQTNSSEPNVSYQLYYKRTYDETYSFTDVYQVDLMKEDHETFSFVVEADPHFDEKSSGNLYKQALSNMLNTNPDFIMDLGDVSMIEKLVVEPKQRYQLIRSYWDDIGHSVPFYMTLGNHDGEAGWDEKKDDLKAVASSFRQAYLPTVTLSDNYNGLSDTIYSFEWAGALIVVLNPFEFTIQKPKGDNWLYTLGHEQYDWLVETLVKSDADYRFIFIHNLIGGINKDNRGGAAGAIYNEWGGYSLNGSYDFGVYRENWLMPIHDVCAKYGVDVVFHGHDHFYAKEELDGVIYQLVPQPSLDTRQNIDNVLEEYGYLEGEFLPSPGFLNVKISNAGCEIDYLDSITGELITRYQLED